MSIPVALAELAARIDEFGGPAYLVTVSPSSEPHVVSVAVAWREDVLVAGTGNRTAANVAVQPTVTLLWPPGDTGSRSGEYSLIVDGHAVVRDGSLEIAPTGAVLHRLAGAAGEGPGCVPVLSPS